MLVAVGAYQGKSRNFPADRALRRLARIVRVADQRDMRLERLGIVAKAAFLQRFAQIMNHGAKLLRTLLDPAQTIPVVFPVACLVQHQAAVDQLTEARPPPVRKPCGIVGPRNASVRWQVLQPRDAAPETLCSPLLRVAKRLRVSESGQSAKTT